jgi:hypothetical protein
MRYLIASLFTLMTLSSFSDTVPKSNFGNGSNPHNAALNTAMGVLVQTLKTENVPKDSISGSCEYNEGSCNGAEISLFYKDQQIYSSTLTNLGQFKIPKLKRLESYKFVITWAKHQLIQTRQVTPGEFVRISLKKN